MKLSTEVRTTHGPDGAVILDILHGQMFRANVVGSRILQLLEAGRTEAEIIEKLMSEFGIPRETISSDVQEFLAHLEKNRLLERREPDALPFL